MEGTLARDPMPHLHPRFADREVLGGLRRRWAETRRLRIEDALRPGLAETLVDAATALGFETFEKHEGEVHALFYRQVQLYQGNERFGPIAEARRLLEVDLPALASAITGQDLHAADRDGFAIDYYTRGAYLDAHTDRGPDRLVAFVVGLTEESWPAEDGGHLEFLAPDESTVVERVAPGFGSIDLFTVHPLIVPHRVPILRRPVTRLSINGWLTGEVAGPGEA